MYIEDFNSFKADLKKYYEDIAGDCVFDVEKSINMSGMISQKRKISKIIVVGCGGTGSWLFPKLVKTINDAKRKNLLTDGFILIAIDADTVEEKNIVRQNFIEADIGMNKAQVMIDRYLPHLYDGCEAVYVDKYITTEAQLVTRDKEVHDKFIRIGELLNSTIMICPENSDVIVFNLVDNNLARQAIHQMPTANFPNSKKLDSKYYIVDTGNDMYNGQFFVSSYVNEYTDPQSNCFVKYYQEKTNFFGYNEEALNATDDVSLYSCAEADVDIDNQDQMLVANDFAATICHNWLINFLLIKMKKGYAEVQKYSDFICGNISKMSTKEVMIDQTMASMFFAKELLLGRYKAKMSEDGENLYYVKTGETVKLGEESDHMVNSVYAMKHRFGINGVSDNGKFMWHSEVKSLNSKSVKAFCLKEIDKYIEKLKSNGLEDALVLKLGTSPSDFLSTTYGRFDTIEAIRKYYGKKEKYLKGIQSVFEQTGVVLALTLHLCDLPNYRQITRLNLAELVKQLIKESN